MLLFLFNTKVSRILQKKIFLNNNDTFLEVLENYDNILYNTISCKNIKCKEGIYFGK